MSYLGNGLLQRHLVGQFVFSSALHAQCRDVARQLDKKGLSALASFSSITFEFFVQVNNTGVPFISFLYCSTNNLQVRQLLTTYI